MCSSFICDFWLLNIKCLKNIKLYHFVRTILSIPLCPIPFCPYTILSIPFCPYHFVPYHFVRSPLPADCQTFNSLVNTAEDRLLSSIIRSSYHVLRPLFPLPSPDGLASANELIHLPYP